MSSAGKVFVGGLCWDSTDETLREHFAKYGELTDVIIMRDKPTGRSRGFGFVTFADPVVIDAVLAEKQAIDGRNVEVKRAVPKEKEAKGDYENRDGNGNDEDTPGRTRKIFVGGLPHNTKDTEFRNYFSQFGTIMEAQVITDRDTGRPRGFGFVSFDSESTVDKIISQTHEIGGKVVELKRAEPKKPVQLSVTSGDREGNPRDRDRSPRSHSRDGGRGDWRDERESYGGYSSFNYGNPEQMSGMGMGGMGGMGMGGMGGMSMAMGMGGMGGMGVNRIEYMGYGRGLYEFPNDYRQSSATGVQARNQASSPHSPSPSKGYPPPARGGPAGYGAPSYGATPGYGGAPGYGHGGPGGGPRYDAPAGYGGGAGYDGGYGGRGGFGGYGGPGGYGGGGRGGFNGYNNGDRGGRGGDDERGGYDRGGGNSGHRPQRDRPDRSYHPYKN